jgi:putative NADH-flavin reductase
VTTSGFSVAYKAEAEKGAEFLDLLRAEKELSWTFLSPLGAAHGWRPNRQVPPWNKPAFDGSRR